MESGFVSVDQNNSGIDGHTRLRRIYENYDFHDVTLVSSDGVRKQAHKIILSSGSLTLKDIIKEYPNQNPVIYLHGVSSKILENILEFIYTCETKVTEDGFELFMNLSNDLKIDGLYGSEYIQNDKVQETQALLNTENKDNENEDFARDSVDNHVQNPTSSRFNSEPKRPDFDSQNVISLTPSNNSSGFKNKINDKVLEGEKFVCAICDEEFNFKTDLNLHLLTHNKPKKALETKVNKKNLIIQINLLFLNV